MALRRLPGRFLKGVQHVDRVSKLCDVEDPVLTSALLDADLKGPGADGFHRLEIGRLLPSLNLVKLVARLPPSAVGKLAEVVAARSNKGRARAGGMMRTWSRLFI